jgi:hypothetical protein
MNKLHKIFVTLLLLLSVGQLYADVATEGEQDIYIEIINAADFPSYKFYIKSQSYYYDMGYQPGELTTVYLEPGKHTSTGDRGSASLLYAEGKGITFQSKSEVGGSTIDHTEGVSYILDRIKIISLKKKVIKFEVVERQLIGEDGKVMKTIKKGSMGSLAPGQLVLYALPVVCLLGLLLFFRFRRKLTAA